MNKLNYNIFKTRIQYIKTNKEVTSQITLRLFWLEKLHVFSRI